MSWFRKKDRSYSTSFPPLAGVLVIIVVIFFSELMHYYELKSVQDKITNGKLSFATALQTKVNGDLNAVLYLSSGLAAYLTVRNSQLTDDEVDKVLESLYQTENAYHIQNFGVAVGYTLRYVYPKEENKAALGLDYRKLPTQWAGVKRAIDSRKGMIDGPVQLKQGGVGLIYRKPIYINNEYWGLLSTVVNFDSFIDEAFSGLNAGNYEFSVRDTQNNVMIWGEPAFFQDTEAMQLVADVPGGQWVYAFRTKDKDDSPSFIVLYRIIGWLTALLFGTSVFWVLHQRKELNKLSMFDTLTGLPNRRLFNDRILQAFNRQQRNKDTRCFIILVDLNGFKEINDLYGHKTGDILLSVIAKRITSVLRINDTVARWGGDEFVLLFEASNFGSMNQFKTRLRKTISEPIEIDGNQIKVGASIGVSSYPNEGKDFQTLLRLADERMYADKHAQKSAGTKQSMQ